MPQKQNTLTWRWFDEVWNGGKEESIDALMHEQAVVHGIEGITEKGTKAFKKFYSDFRNEFTNISVEVEEVVAESGFESSRCKVTATHAATGQPVSFSGQTTVKVENGKITEGWNNFDFLSMYKQLGFALMPNTPVTN